MKRREFLKIMIAALFLIFLQPLKIIQKLAPRGFLYAKSGKNQYPGKEKVFKRSLMTGLSSYAG